jgi:hypothetical protein
MQERDTCPPYACEDVERMLPDYKDSGSEVIILLFTSLYVHTVCYGTHVGVLVICVLVFTVFLYCFIYVYLFLCILIVMYVLFCIFCFHLANWHSSAILTEIFACFFLSCKGKCQCGPHSSQINCVVCRCVLYYCHWVANQLQLTNTRWATKK